jgi:hypothetical protein
MRLGSLSSRIILSVSGLLVALITATLVFVGYQADRFVTEQLDANLEQAEASVGLVLQLRLDGLRQTASLTGSIPSLNALVSLTDAVTLTDVLTIQVQDNPNSDLTIMLDPGGRVLARTDSITPFPIDDPGIWIDSVLSGTDSHRNASHRRCGISRSLGPCRVR